MVWFCVMNPKISRFLQTLSFYSLCSTDYPGFKFRQSLEGTAWISGLGPLDVRTCFLIVQVEMLNPSVVLKINPNLNPILKIFAGAFRWNWGQDLLKVQLLISTKGQKTRVVCSVVVTAPASESCL